MGEDRRAAHPCGAQEVYDQSPGQTDESLLRYQIELIERDLALDRLAEPGVQTCVLLRPEPQSAGAYEDFGMIQLFACRIACGEYFIGLPQVASRTDLRQSGRHLDQRGDSSIELTAADERAAIGIDLGVKAQATRGLYVARCGATVARGSEDESVRDQKVAIGVLPESVMCQLVREDGIDFRALQSAERSPAEDDVRFAGQVVERGIHVGAADRLIQSDRRRDPEPSRDCRASLEQLRVTLGAEPIALFQ